jgi:hypothetical protein
VHTPEVLALGHQPSQRLAVLVLERRALGADPLELGVDVVAGLGSGRRGICHCGLLWVWPEVPRSSGDLTG